jgi:Holliday junction resolvase-like predicted endonuclease
VSQSSSEASQTTSKGGRNSTRIARILEETGPALSGDFARNLVNRNVAASESSARKMVERCRKAGAIRSTAPVSFDRSYLCFLEKHNGIAYANALKAAFTKKPSFDRVYKTLLANKGYITHGQIAKAATCTADTDSAKPGGRTTPLDISKQLTQVEAIEPVVAEDFLFRIGAHFGPPAISKNSFLKRLETEQMMIREIREWLTHCYLLSPEAHSIRTSSRLASGFNQVQWDLHGPIYVGPMSTLSSSRRLKTNGDFLTAEICTYRTFTTVDTDALIERVDSVNHRWKSISLTPIVVAAGFSEDAWMRLRKAGIAAIKLSDVLGRNIERLLHLFWDAVDIKLESVTGVDEIEEVLAAAASTAGSDGLVGNLKGALFELMVALLLRAQGYDIVLQKRVRKPDEDIDLEIDIVATRGESECLLVECKGRHREYTDNEDELKRHFHDRCKAASDPYGWDVVRRYGEVKAVFVTTGKLSKKADQFAQRTTKSHGILCEIQQRDELIGRLQRAGQNRLAELVNRYY